MIKMTTMGVSLALTLALAVPVFSQAPAAAADGPAYTAFYNEKDNAKKADLGEKFMKDFKDTSAQYSEYVAQQTAKLYNDLKNYKKAMDIADLSNQLMPNAKPATKAYVNSVGMQAALQANSAEKAISFGEKVVAAKPDDLNALVTLTTVIPGNLPKDEAAKNAALDNAMKYGKTVLAMPKPAAVDDATWQTSVQSPVHQALGSIYYDKLQYEQAVTEFDLAVKSNPKDSDAQYQLGLADRGIALAVRPKVVEAFNTFNEAVNSKADKTITDPLNAKADEVQKEFNDKLTVAIDALTKAASMGNTAAQGEADKLKKLLP